MKSFLNLAKTRKTTYEYTDKKITDEQINKILEAGRWAPSASNSQPWKFIVIKNSKKIIELMKLPVYGAFYSEPPLLIALILDNSCWIDASHRCVKEGKLGIYEAYICIGQPALNMVYEAQELGIGTAMLTPKHKEAAKILKLKQGDAVPLILAFGYENPNAYKKPKTRKTIKEITYYEYLGGK